MVDLLYTTPQLLNLLYQLYYTTPLITEPTVHFPLITMYTVMDYIQEHSKPQNNKIQLDQGTLKGLCWCQGLCWSLCNLRPQWTLSYPHESLAT